MCLSLEPRSVQPLLLCTLHPPALRRAVPQPGGGHMPSPLLPEARPHLRVLICFWPNPRPCLLCWAQDRRRVCRPPSPRGHGGLLMRAKPGPPLHVAWGCSPDPRHRPEKTGAGLQGCRSEAGKREEPSPWPLTEAHLDPKSQIQQHLFSSRLTLVRTPSSPPHSRLPAQCLPPSQRGHTDIHRQARALLTCVCRDSYAHLRTQALRNAPTNTQY